MSNNVIAIVLAAGKGTRMKSSKAKVLHTVASKPMIEHVLDSLLPLKMSETVVVIGHQAEKIEAALKNHKVTFARQKEQLGTAHAVLAAGKVFEKFNGTVMILCGDTPLIRSSTLEKMLGEHRDSGSAITVMSTILDDPTNYGRIVTGLDKEVSRIVEEKDATPVEKKICEINAGVYCVESELLREGLDRIGNENSQGEYYLTDLVAIAIDSGRLVNRFQCDDPVEVLGVNSTLELAEANREMLARERS